MEMAQTFATVVPVSMTLDPIRAAEQLRPYVAPMFPEVWFSATANKTTKRSGFGGPFFDSAPLWE